jgi:hypothetical protein
VTTDKEGRVTFPPGVTTHVRLGLPEGVVPRGGALVPDTCEEAQIVVPVRGRVRLALLAAEGFEPPPSLRTYALAPVPADAKGAPARSVEPEPWLFTRAGDVDVDGRKAALYEGWVPMDVSSKVLLRLPGEQDPREIDLAAGGTLHIEGKQAEVKQAEVKQG